MRSPPGQGRGDYAGQLDVATARRRLATTPAPLPTNPTAEAETLEPAQ